MSIDNIQPCLNGCTTAGTGDPIYTESKALICNRCEGRLHHWLTTIPDNYALLPTFIEHGVVEKNPESKSTRSSNASAPMRLDIIDLLDTRLGRIWDGTAPAHDRRGVVGLLRTHAERVVEERPVPFDLHDPTVTQLCAFLDRHRIWIAEHDWVTDLYEDLRRLHRTLSDAIGDYQRPPVGHCHIDQDDGTRCNGPLFANPYGGVRCARCNATWDAARLRYLGLAQAEAAAQ